MWKASPACQSIKQLLVDNVLTQDKLQISSCMCLGRGPMINWEGNAYGKGFENRSLAQLVAFESWVEILC